MTLHSENSLIFEFFDADLPRQYEIYLYFLQDHQARMAYELRKLIIQHVGEEMQWAWWKSVLDEENFSDFSG